MENGASFGGALANKENMVMVTDSSFVANSASSAGGAVRVDSLSSTRFERCFFGTNVASFGGAINATFGIAEIVDCWFRDNEAFTSGGAVYSFDDLTIINSEFFMNSAAADGGAIRSGTSIFAMINSTLIANVSESGGGLWMGGGTATVTNSVFWINQPNQIAGSGSTSVFYSDIMGGWGGKGSNNINLNPLFIDMTKGDLHLQPDSPCIDMGDNAAVPEDVTTDLDGNPRLVDGNGDGEVVVDMGAYEFQTDLPCPWDLNGDGEVGPFDLALVLGFWGPCEEPCTPEATCTTDLAGDCATGPFDLALILGFWGPCE